MNIYWLDFSYFKYNTSRLFRLIFWCIQCVWNLKKNLRYLFSRYLFYILQYYVIILLFIGFSEWFGTTGRTFGPDGIQRCRQNHPVELADFQERPERDRNGRKSNQRRANQQHHADGHFRVRPTTRPVHRNAHRPRTFNLPGTNRPPILV